MTQISTTVKLKYHVYTFRAIDLSNNFNFTITNVIYFSANVRLVFVAGYFVQVTKNHLKSFLYFLSKQHSYNNINTISTFLNTTRKIISDTFSNYSQLQYIHLQIPLFSMYIHKLCKLKNTILYLFTKLF